MATSDDEILTAREVAQMLKVSLGWVHDHSTGRHKPVLPSRKFGKLVRYLRPEILEFLERSKRAMARGLPMQ